MGDFDTIDRSRRMSKAGSKEQQKSKHLCQYEDCNSRWTHSDTPGGGMGYCGYHYHAKRGPDQVEAWKKRNAQVIQDNRKIAAGFSHYDVPSRKQVAPAHSVFEYAQRIVSHETDGLQ